MTPVDDPEPLQARPPHVRPPHVRPLDAQTAENRRVLRIDCSECAHRDSPVCADCLVTFLCEHEDDGAVVVPISEIRAVRMLQAAGLAPQIRHRSTRVS